MRFILLAVLLVAYVCSTEAVIRCDENFCKTVTCDTTLTREKCLAKGEAGRFVFNERGSQCGCCDHCMGIINENEDCAELVMLKGKFHDKQCGTGLLCDPDSRVCKKNP